MDHAVLVGAINLLAKSTLIIVPILLPILLHVNCSWFAYTFISSDFMALHKIDLFTNF